MDGELTQTEEKAGQNPFIGKFEAFLKAQYRKQIEQLVENYPEKRSLLVDFKDIEHYDYELADELLVNPDYVVQAAETALANIDIPTLSIESFKPHVRVFNLPKDSQPILRDIGAKHLGKLISVEGVVRMMTEVLPKLSTATWECKRCGNTYKIIQSSQQVRKPAICECKHRDFELVAKQSEFVDLQKAQVQEPLELLKGNEQPTNLDIYVSDDLVNKIAPGDRTRITGVLRLYSPKEKKVVYGRYMEAIHVEETAKEFREVEITKEEAEEIKKLAKNPKIYEMLIASIAPAIYGHDNVKEAIVLQLFGGVRKLLPGDAKIRGDIHVLLVGEPGLAKSQLLQAVDSIAPKSIYTAGKTTSGVGLTATAVKDEFGEGGWTLKAGALILASGGIAMVDELDKMDDEDRGALHEIMEQQACSVAKAGIVTRFKAETSILAAANPKFSRFDPYQNFLEQVNLPSTLMSRFDLFFLMRDVLDRKGDSEIATHILKTHQVGELMQQQQIGKAAVKEADLEKMKIRITPAIEGDLLRKYISYTRQEIFPNMSDENIKQITEYYVDLRDKGKKEGAYAATHRQLEALVRLAEASARIRLSETVKKQDVDRAIKIFSDSLKELVTDLETGRPDIDIITSGQTYTQLTNLKRILSIIKTKTAEGVDMVPREDIIDEAKVEGIDEDKARDLIGKLKKQGEIYEPRTGFLKPTTRK